jgi:hypothetical protein
MSIYWLPSRAQPLSSYGGENGKYLSLNAGWARMRYERHAKLGINSSSKWTA